MNVTTHKLYLGDEYEIRLAEQNKAIQVELAGEAVGQFLYLIRRGCNTIPPQQWPSWLKDLDEGLEN